MDSALHVQAILASWVVSMQLCTDLEAFMAQNPDCQDMHGTAWAHTCIVRWAAVLVPSEMGFIDVELHIFEVLGLPVHDIAVQVADIVHDDLLWQLREACEQDLKDSPAVANPCTEGWRLRHLLFCRQCSSTS